jgi:acyl carrier protein
MRIELGEVEAVLSQHPAVASAVVVVQEETTDDKHLVAYVVPLPDLVPTSSELRHFLQAKLPDYMVPAAFVLLAALPLTPNGKVDRQALPAPDQARLDLEKVFVAPRTPIEETVTRVWMEVLGRQQVSIYDNFFELGGHSLLAAQVIYRLREVFLVDLPLRSLFETPTVAGVAAVVAQQQGEQAEHDRIAQALADIEQLSAADVHTLLTVEGEASDDHEASC